IPASFILIAFMLLTGVFPTVLSYPHILKFAMLCVILQCFELYRQRFYLDWRNECGVHWRAWILQFAKWPYMLLALYDTITSHKFPYVLTRKVKSPQRCSMLLWPKMLVIFLMCACAVIGIIFDHTANVFLYLLALIVSIISGTLIVSE